MACWLTLIAAPAKLRSLCSAPSRSRSRSSPLSADIAHQLSFPALRQGRQRRPATRSDHQEFNFTKDLTYYTGGRWLNYLDRSVLRSKAPAQLRHGEHLFSPVDVACRPSSSSSRAPASDPRSCRQAPHQRPPLGRGGCSVGDAREQERLGGLGMGNRVGRERRQLRVIAPHGAALAPS